MSSPPLIRTICFDALSHSSQSITP
jgi:hypothetical protein